MAYIMLSAEHQDSMVRVGGKLWKISSPPGLTFTIKYGKTTVFVEDLVNIRDPWAPSTYEYTRDDNVRFRCKRYFYKGSMVWTDFENKKK